MTYSIPLFTRCSYIAITGRLVAGLDGRLPARYTLPNINSDEHDEKMSLTDGRRWRAFQLQSSSMNLSIRRQQNNTSDAIKPRICTANVSTQQYILMGRLKTREWKTWHHRKCKEGKRRSGKRGTRWHRWKMGGGNTLIRLFIAKNIYYILHKVQCQ